LAYPTALAPRSQYAGKSINAVLIHSHADFTSQVIAHAECISNTVKIKKLMRLACYGFLAFAFFWWLATIPSLDWPAKLILDISDWPIDGSHDNLSRDAQFLSAIGSGLLAGFSFLLLLVVVPEIERGNSAVVRGTVVALLAWYFIDSIGCLLLGIVSNAILNTIYLATILPPLLLAARALKSAVPPNSHF